MLRLTSYSLDTSEHGRGPLLEFLLIPWASNLTFEEVVHQILGENRDKMKSSLNNVWGLQAWLQGELEDLQQARKDESSTSAQRRMKKQKDLQSLKATISKYEFHLRRCCEDDPSNSEAEGAMAITPVTDDAPSASTTPESLTSPPGEEQTRTMEVDDEDEHQAPASPVSPREDELLTGNTVVGVEGEMANLTVSSPGEGEGGDKGASI